MFLDYGGLRKYSVMVVLLWNMLCEQYMQV